MKNNQKEEEEKKEIRIKNPKKAIKYRMMFIQM
jgi:hypothetical protein